MSDTESNVEFSGPPNQKAEEIRRLIYSLVTLPEWKVVTMVLFDLEQSSLSDIRSGDVREAVSAIQFIDKVRAKFRTLANDAGVTHDVFAGQSL